MPTYKYSTSVNIVRDADRELTYHPTPNARRVVGQIAADFEKGLRSFNIIGTYGTGKSSLLWAFEKSVIGKKDFFKVGFLPNPTVAFINIVGEYRSMLDVFVEKLELDVHENTVQNVCSDLFHRYSSLGKENAILFIVIDEFGKFLEHAARHNPEQELYVIQQLTEFANNSDHNICLITSVHQNFDAYAQNLSDAQQQEWRKVKGRFREITFNEPVEQLLYLAAEHLDGSETRTLPDSISESVDLAVKTKAFRLDKAASQEIAAKLYPLDLLSGGVLALSLQRYGQNERSLFSFLESTDFTGIDSVSLSRDNPFYNLANVYDYLFYNFYSYLQSKHNHDYFKWVSIRSALDAVERSTISNVEAGSKLVKTIGLLSIWISRGTNLGEDFLTNYAKTCLGISQPGLLIQELEDLGVILYRVSNGRFVLFEGSDLDIQLALIEAKTQISEIIDVATALKSYFEFPPIEANKNSYETGTPRTFEYVISDHPVDLALTGEIDGYINLIFNGQVDLESVKEASRQQEEAILYGYFEEAEKIKQVMTDIAKAEHVIIKNDQDKVAVRELQEIIEDHKRELTQLVFNSFYGDSVTWIFRGEVVYFPSAKAFHKYLSQICQTVYPGTPVFKNELVNRHKISGSIHAAKRMYLQALADNWNLDTLGFAEERFPPEKTIFLTLVKENGLILSNQTTDASNRIASDSSFQAVWAESRRFLDDSKRSRLPVSELVTRLSARPFKLKRGLIDFWVPTFLFANRDSFALFSNNGYEPTLAGDILELISKSPEKYEIKAFDLDGIKLMLFNKYRSFLNQSVKEDFDNPTFIETIKPFLVFYRDLPAYAKETKRLSPEALALRETIASSVDPEKTFFEEFPLALGYSLESLYATPESSSDYVKQMEDAVREIRTAYNALIDRFEAFIRDEYVGSNVSFEEYKQSLRSRYAKLEKHLLLPNQKTFIQRLDSALDDRDAWLNSIAQAVMGKALNSFTDKDEVALYQKFKRLILDLDSLTAISEADVDTEAEDVVSLEINTFVGGLMKKLVRLPKQKREQVAKIEDKLRTQLIGDDSLDIAALTNLLNELLKR
ncbi:hypothetical protein [Persicitalea jodogahamensis]|uniref:ATP-binding protein n=1 Tax=Persicitalea jodogahamensis TaxID=402147 RepID=A0A8J3GC77_9BACT|nr:hypothetical protein [Persicitalea jodogahamensis]GHB82846.1 hypothetical protein GCM10007390_42160 [Persicitalea jodogahamensis]